MLQNSAGLYTLDVINLDETEDSLLLQQIMNHQVVLHEKHS